MEALGQESVGSGFGVLLVASAGNATGSVWRCHPSCSGVSRGVSVKMKISPLLADAFLKEKLAKRHLIKNRWAKGTIEAVKLLSQRDCSVRCNFGHGHTSFSFSSGDYFDAKQTELPLDYSPVQKCCFKYFINNTCCLMGLFQIAFLLISMLPGTYLFLCVFVQERIILWNSTQLFISCDQRCTSVYMCVFCRACSI